MTIDHIIDLVTRLVYNLQTRNQFLMTSAKMKLDVINQLLLSRGTISESRNNIACLDPQKPSGHYFYPLNLVCKFCTYTHKFISRGHGSHMWLTFDFKMCLSKFSVLAPVFMEIHHVILEILKKSTRGCTPEASQRVNRSRSLVWDVSGSIHPHLLEVNKIVAHVK